MPDEQKPSHLGIMLLSIPDVMSELSMLYVVLPNSGERDKIKKRMKALLDFIAVDTVFDGQHAPIQAQPMPGLDDYMPAMLPPELRQVRPPMPGPMGDYMSPLESMATQLQPRFYPGSRSFPVPGAPVVNNGL